MARYSVSETTLPARRRSNAWLTAVMPWKLALRVSLAAAAGVLLGCARLPYNFDSLPLDQQVKAYSRFLEASGGRPWDDATAAISWHGWIAADLLAKSLEGRRSDLPPVEALKIIAKVQCRGCSLKGTEADRAVTQYLAHAQKGTLEWLCADGAAYAIAKDVMVEHLDHLKGGPCGAGLEEKLKQRRSAHREAIPWRSKKGLP